VRRFITYLQYFLNRLNAAQDQHNPPELEIQTNLFFEQLRGINQDIFTVTTSRIACLANRSSAPDNGRNFVVTRLKTDCSCSEITICSKVIFPFFPTNHLQSPCCAWNQFGMVMADIISSCALANFWNRASPVFTSLCQVGHKNSCPDLFFFCCLERCPQAAAR